MSTEKTKLEQAHDKYESMKCEDRTYWVDVIKLKDLYESHIRELSVLIDAHTIATAFKCNGCLYDLGFRSKHEHDIPCVNCIRMAKDNYIGVKR